MSDSFLSQEKGLISVVLKNIGDGVISTDMNGIIDFMNNSAEQITGWESNQALGKPLDTVFRLVNRVSGEFVKSPFINAVAGTQIGLSNNTALITKNGTEKLVSANISSIQDEHGRIDGVVVILRDITRFKQYEDELMVERNNLRVNFEHAPIGMAIVSEDFKVLDTNNSFLDMFGIEYGGIVGKSFGEGVYCKNSNESECGSRNECRKCNLQQSIAEVSKNAIPIKNLKYEATLCRDRKDLYKYFKVNLVPIIDSGVTNVMVSIEDMSEHKMMEERLIKSRDFYLTLFDDFPALIWRTDSSMKRNYFNKRWLDFRGRTLDEELNEGWRDGIHHEDIEECYRKYIENIKNGLPNEMEYRIKRFDGQFRWIMDRASPYYDLDGNFAGYIGACYDITEQKSAEIALKKYQVLAEKARDTILFVNMDGTIIEANESALKSYGYSRGEILTKSIFDLRGGDPETRNQMDLAKQKGLFFEATHYRKDGSAFPVEVSVQSTSIGERVVLLSIIRDITERKQVEAEMKKAIDTAHEAYKAKSEFLANMSHEIRTPLNGVVGMIDLTMLTELSAEQKDNLLTAKTCADSLLKIINDILDFSKIEAGKLTIEKIDFDLKLLIEKITKIHNYRAIEKGLELNCQLPVDLPLLLRGDPARIQQVLNNLIGNAVKFTEKGSVNITIKSLGCINEILKLQFMVADTGIGIAPEEEEKLFKSFSQVDGTHSRKFGGTGLGLVISKQLVEMMGGSIWVESEKGKGSSFYLELDFEISSRNREARDTIGFDKTAKVQNKANVLLVEDDNINQIVVSRMLKEMGYSYSIVNNGLEAVNILNEKSFDICLMDIQMPSMDGIQTTAAIRSNEKSTRAHLPIVALTAHALLGDKEKFISLGMDDYLAKPFQMNDLYNTIEGLLEKHQSENPTDIFKKLISEAEMSDIAELKGDEFSEKIKSRILEISEHISNLLELSHIGDVATIEKLAHEIKLISSEINADKVKSLAFRIELAARKGDFAGAYSLFNELNGVFKEFCHKFSSEESLSNEG